MELNYKRKLLFAQSGVNMEETYKGLRLRALEDNVKFKFTVADKISYSINEGISWINVTEADSEFPYITLKNGDSIIIKGKFTSCSSSTTTNGSIYSTGLYEASGNIMSLMADSIDETTGNIVSTGMVTEDGNVLSTDLSNYKYAFCNLFKPLDETIQYYLQDVSKLKLPATVVATHSYDSMFMNCKSITIAPELPATTLNTYCYSDMFRNCTSLTTAPELPATTLKNYCYARLFQNCPNLTTAPELPATTLANYCYNFMFAQCTGLTTAPELPATTLKSNCYNRMFYMCTGLTVAPLLPATTLTTACYAYMFNGCSKLSSIVALFTAPTNWTSYTSNWVGGVAETGTFERSKNATWEIIESASAIPPGWEVISSYDPITITNKGTTNINIGFNKKNNYILKYNIINTGDEIDTSLITNQLGDSTVSLSPNKSMVFMGDATTINNIGKFNITSTSGIPNIQVSGSILSLVYGDEYNTHDILPVGFKFTELFAGTDITDASSLKLNIRDLSQNSYCYEGMFNGCEYLLNAPELPTTALSEGCYYRMFVSCLSLQTMPNIKATTLAEYCCHYMFWDCSELVNTTPLLATELAKGCYSYMFADCISLTNVSGLQLNKMFTYATGCFEGMFSRCINLNDLTGVLNYPSLNNQSTTLGAYSYMFEGCSSLTDASNINIFINENSDNACKYMFGGCYNLTKPPKLDSQQLAPYCYYEMFSGCSALEVGPDLVATNLLGSLISNSNYEQGAYNCYEGMFSGCGNLKGLKSTPNVIYLPATTLASYCYYRMFEGCESITAVEIEAMSPFILATSTKNYYAYGCYFGLFNGCSLLNEITMQDIYMAGGIKPVNESTNKYRFPYSNEWDPGESSSYYRYPEDFDEGTRYSSNYIDEWWVYGIRGSGTFHLNSSSKLGYMVRDVSGLYYGAVPVDDSYNPTGSGWEIITF